MSLPLTLSSTDSVLTPALFEALHVYVPLCLWPTDGIMRRLPIGPVDIVVMPKSDVMLEPWNDQEMLNGWSP